MPVPQNYAFHNIWFEAFCIAVASILLYKQFSVFHEDKVQRTFTKILFIQIAYFASFIVRVLIDVAVLPKTQISVYAVNIINFGLFATCSWFVFSYLELYQNAKGFSAARTRALYAIPYLCNVAILLSSPWTHAYFGVDENANVLSGSLWKLMVTINCSYPLAAILLSLFARFVRHENADSGDFKLSVVFPLFFAVFGPVSALQWRIPILPTGLMLADLFVYIHYTDILTRERNSALARSLDEAERANKAKSAFLSNMSHDIRTPMNAIVGFTNLALKNPADAEKTTEYLEKIKASSDHLLSLINDVLEMSRIESGKIELDETPCSLSEILHDLNTIIIGQVTGKQQELFMDAVNVTDENIICDKLRLNQILLNLLSNATKYTPSGGKISVRVVQMPESSVAQPVETTKNQRSAIYQIRVKDNGIGMSPEFAARVFEAFEREKTSTVSGIQGTGLGMAITKRLVELMGGTISVQTEEGKGTEFIVTVRFKTQEGKAKSLRIAELTDMHALVVDDDFDTCDSTTRMLSEMGLRPEWTLSGKEAVLRAKQAAERGDAFHVFIIDWRLPDLNGIEVARQIRNAVGNDTPILLMTAYDWPAIKGEAVAAGVNGFCNKPIFPPELHNTLVSVIGTASKESAESAAAESAGGRDFSGMRLLLVDDMDVNREIALMLLEMHGFEVEQAVDGKEAVEKVRSADAGYYDAVLMDVQMPVMNGYEATRAIRALESDRAKVPIVAMTANAFDEDKKAALESGMNAHVAKPIDEEQVLSVIAELTGR